MESSNTCLGLRKATDPCTRKAFQILIKGATKKRKKLLVMRDLLQWARKKEGEFGRSRRTKKATVLLPKSLAGHENRNQWDDLLTKFYGGLYSQDSSTKAQAFHMLRRLKSRASNDATKLVCHANELRDIGISIFPNRVAGRNVIRSLPYVAFLFLAQQFTHMANDDDKEPTARPASWWCLPKAPFTKVANGPFKWGLQHRVGLATPGAGHLWQTTSWRKTAVQGTAGCHW